MNLNKYAHSLTLYIRIIEQENEKSRDIMIEQRFHKTIIGAQGGKIKEIRDRFNQVQITFPDANRRSEVVSLRGPKSDVDKCFRYLQTMHQELIANNFQADVHIFKQFHKNIIGKGGATIRKVKLLEIMCVQIISLW